MIVLTARHGPDATAEGLAAGADDYITKPFSTDELLARVHATTNWPGSGNDLRPGPAVSSSARGWKQPGHRQRRRHP